MMAVEGAAFAPAIVLVSDSSVTVPQQRTVPRGVILGLRESGVDVVARAAALGGETVIVDGYATVFVADLARVLDRVSAEGGRPSLGIEVGSRVRPELIGVVGLAAMSAPTFGDAVARCARYKKLLS